MYKDDILSKNLALNDFRLVVSLGKVPDFLKNKEVSANLILLKNNTKCDYRVPVTIPSAKYSLIPIKPNLYNPNISLKTEGISFVKEIFFDFASSKIIPKNITAVKFKKENINSIDIKSYTSVDGSFKNNKYLYNARANFIKNYLIRDLNFNHRKITVQAKENWDLFNFQLEIYGYKSELNKTKKEKRFLANTKLKEYFFKEFSDQRKSKATIFEKGNWKNTHKKHGYFNLINALLTKNNELANKSLFSLYQQEKTELILDQDFILDRLIHKKELVQNTTALIIKNIHYYQVDNIIYYINYWLKRSNELNKETQKNLLNLYTITAKQILMFWDTDTERLARILHPTKVETLFKNYASKINTDPLYLNYHMAIIEYYGQINNYSKIEDSFNFITNYFKKRSLTIDDTINLALFFNNWSRYDLTLELLSKAYLNDQLNEQATFLYVQTLNAYPKNYNEIVIETIHKIAIKTNKKRWCNWISNDFQNLRQRYIKDLYCYECNK